MEKMLENIEISIHMMYILITDILEFVGMNNRLCKFTQGVQNDHHFIQRRVKTPSNVSGKTGYIIKKA